MTRFLLSSVAAVMLLAAPVAASAATKPVHAAKHMKAKPAMKASMRHGKMMMSKPVRRDPGSAAVDALNDQSLAAAKAGQ